LRICIVTVASYAHGIGGMQRHGLDLVRGLVRAGHEVEVVSPRRGDGVMESEHEGARWHFVEAPSIRPGMPMRHPLWLRRSADAFDDLHARRPFDVVHSESTSGLGLLRRNVHHRVPFAVKFHGNYLGLVKAAVGRGARASTAAARIWEAKHVVWISGQHFIPPDGVFRFRSCEAMVPSQQQADDTRRSYLLRRDRVHLVPNGVDVELFRPHPRVKARAELGLPAGPLLVGVGRLNREKGFHHAIRALSHLDEARLLLVGTGEDKDYLKGLARDLNLADRVLFAGKQSTEQVASYLAAADIFVFPTDRDEAAPLVLLEAMASGLPVIASSIGGVTEVIDRPGANGFLLRPGDVAGLVQVLSDLLSDPERRERVGSSARARVLEQYTLERMIERTLDVYDHAARRLGLDLGAGLTSSSNAA
jgi:glycosyltransferase involved in cell wall biosynthesis